MASTTTWIGSDGSGALSGTWNSTGSVWSGGVVPGAGDDVVLDTVSGTNRIVTITGTNVAVSSTINSLTFNQSAPYLNELQILGGTAKSATNTVTVTSPLTIASTSGTVLLYLNTTANTYQNANLFYVGNINIGANGILEMGNYSNTNVSTVSGTVDVQNGGKINFDLAVSGFNNGTISNLLLENGGALNFNTTNSGGLASVSNEGRLTVGNITVNTGAAINAVEAGTLSSGTMAKMQITGTSAIFHSGITGNFLTGAASGIYWQGTQSDPGGASVFTLASDTALPALFIQPSGTTSNIVNVTLGSYTPGQTLSMASLQINPGATSAGALTGATEITLGSNVTITNGNPLVYHNANGASVRYNLNGYTLTLGGYFSPSGGYTTNLFNSSIVGSGTIQASYFIFNGNTAVGSTSNIGAGVVLTATGSGFNNLSGPANGSGTIDPTSTFAYVGVSGSMSSSRAIGRLRVGRGSSSTLQLSSSASSTLTVGGDVTVNTNGVLDLFGNTLTETSAAGANAGGLNGAGTILNNATATASTLTIDTTAGNGSFSGAIINHSTGTGTVAFTKVGLGTQTLSGVNTYTGATTISKGTLALVGGGSIANSSSISVAKDATLDVASKTGGFTVGSAQTLTNNGGVTGNVVVSGELNGTGTITGDVSLVGGTLAPGNSPGIQTITGSLTFDANSILDMQLRKDSTTSSLSLIAGTDYDQVAVGGALTLAGTLNLEINWGLQPTDAFMLILNSSSVGVSGSFSTLMINGVKANDFANNSFIYSGQEYTLRYVNADSGAVANDLELIAVPEPGTWAMFVGGFVMLLGAQRMRRRSE